MKKSEMFNILVSKVCEICEVSRTHLIGGSRLQSVVDARLLAVQYLRRIGLSSDEIALIAMRENADNPDYCPPLEEIKKKAKAVNKIFNSYSERCLQSYSFCLMSMDVKEFCRESYKNLYIAGMKDLPPYRGE